MSRRVSLTCAIPWCLVLAIAACTGSVWAQDSTTHRTKKSGTTGKPATKKPVTVKPDAQPAQPATGGRTLMTINGSVVDEAHFRKAIEDKWGKPVLDDIIRERVVRQEARARGLKTAGPEWAAQMDAAISQQRAEYPSESEFLGMLQDKGYSIAGFRRDVETKLIIDQLIAQKVTVTPAEIQKYYEAHKAEYSTPDKIHLFDIVTATSEDADKARDRLDKGDTFAAVASEMSSDKDTAQKGGEVGYVTREDIADPVLREAAFSMQATTVSSPLPVGDHFHILFIKDTRPGKAATLGEVKADITAKLRAQKGMSPDDYVASLLRKADIKVAWTPFKYIEGVYAGMKGIQIIVDGQPLKLATHPVILPNGTMLVPAKPVLSAAHVQTAWNIGPQQLVATTKTNKVAVTVGSPTGLANGKPIRLPEGPQLRNGLLFIPPRAILEALGGTVSWDATRNALIVTSPGKAAPTAVNPALAPQPTPALAPAPTPTSDVAPTPSPAPTPAPAPAPAPAAGPLPPGTGDAAPATGDAAPAGPTE